MSAITISGNVATEVELRFLTSGTAVATFLVISSKRQKDAQGEWEDVDKTAWNIKCWKNLAENVAECILKGLPVVISGDVIEEKWEKDGEKRSKMVVNAYHVGIDLSRTLAKKVEGQERGGRQSVSHAPASANRASDPWASATEDAPPF